MAKTRFQSRLEAKIAQVLVQKGEELCRGIPPEKYNNEVWFCEGLRAVLQYCDEIEQQENS